MPTCVKSLVANVSGTAVCSHATAANWSVPHTSALSSADVLRELLLVTQRDAGTDRLHAVAETERRVRRRWTLQSWRAEPAEPAELSWLHHQSDDVLYASSFAAFVARSIFLRSPTAAAASDAASCAHCLSRCMSVSLRVTVCMRVTTVSRRRTT